MRTLFANLETVADIFSCLTNSIVSPPALIRFQSFCSCPVEEHPDAVYNTSPCPALKNSPTGGVRLQDRWIHGSLQQPLIADYRREVDDSIEALLPARSPI